MTKVTRVLHILSTADVAATGIVRVVQALASQLDPQAYSTTAWFLLGDGPLREELEGAGVPARVVHWRPSPRDPVGAVRFWRALRRQRFDILHQHFGGPNVRRVARWATSAPILLHLHGRVAETANPVPLALPTQGADMVIAASQAVAGCATPGLARVVYPAVPATSTTRVAARGTRDSLVIGTAGRLIALKRIDDLLRAFALVAPAHPGARLEIAGDGSQAASLARLAGELGIESRVRFLGWVRDLSGLWRHWDIYTHPSLEEGLPISVLEAMQAGLPVVATAVGGIPELVQTGATGLLVPAGDVSALAGCMSSLLGDEAMRTRMGESGQARAQQLFSAHRLAAEMAGIYDELIARRTTSMLSKSLAY